MKRIVFYSLLLVVTCSMHAVEGIFTGSRAVTANQGYDFSGNTVIIAAVGNIQAGVLSDHSTWTVTTVSNGISYINQAGPVVFANSAGDIVIAWSYLDENYLPQIAASILPRGSSTWYPISITTGTGPGSNNYNDQSLVGDDNGNVLLTWTSYDSISGSNQVYGATALLSTSTVWSEPFLVFQS